VNRTTMRVHATSSTVPGADRSDGFKPRAASTAVTDHSSAPGSTQLGAAR
jgi:hypothetical protein